MSSKLLIRIAAALMLLHTIGHCMGVFGKLDPSTVPVMNAMKSQSFPFMGRSCTLADFYNGYGFTMIFVLVLVSALLWILSAEAQKSKAAVLQLRLIAGFILVMAVIEYIYFFPFAAGISLLASILTSVGLLLRKPANA